MKRMEVAGSHNLLLPYQSKCSQVHGHNWIIVVEVVGEKLNRSGMLVDFTHISKTVMELDHKHINDCIPKDMNPTAENIAQFLAGRVNEAIAAAWDGDVHYTPRVSKVSVQESEGNICEWIEDDAL
jgi:6-pyruvoyltetrahydropterin/6-carboxytetrahydropterin synthase